VRGALLVIDDPVESRLGRVEGLGLLPVRVMFGAAKRLGRPAARDAVFAGHVGPGSVGLAHAR